MTETTPDGTDIAELFARDPQKGDFTDKDIDSIITYFRDRQRQFAAGNLLAGKTKAPKIGAAAQSLMSTVGKDIKL